MKAIQTILLITLLIGGTLLYMTSNWDSETETTKLAYNEPNQQIRQTEKAYNPSPYSAFGDDSYVLMTEKERTGNHILEIPVSESANFDNLSKLSLNMKTGKVKVYDKEGTVLKELVLPSDVMSRFLSVDPLAEDYYSIAPYAYVANNPMLFIDPDGRSIWIPSLDNNGNIILTAEEGDNHNTLMEFFGGEENAEEFLPSWAMNENIQYTEGSEVALNEDNVFSQTMNFYSENSNLFKNRESYDCKELCRQLVLNESPILSNKGTGNSPQDLASYGRDMKKKEKIESSKKQFGKTFSNWSYTPPLGDHAAINFGKDRKGNEYFFTKNGARGELTIQPLSEMGQTYTLWNFFRTDYKKK